MIRSSSTKPRITRLAPSDYQRTPWKNGGGVTIDIAGAWRAESPGDWTGVIWRFGRTSITTPAPFSDLSGYDRAQMVVRGRGLALQTPDGEIDVRAPFTRVRFAGETPIVSKLDHGPVDVVNLIADRAMVAIELRALKAGDSIAFEHGVHLAYAPDHRVELSCDAEALTLDADHALQIDDSAPHISCAAGILIVATISAIV